MEGALTDDFVFQHEVRKTGREASLERKIMSLVL